MYIFDFSDYFSKLFATIFFKNAQKTLDTMPHMSTYPRDTDSTVPCIIYTEILFVKAYFYIKL